MQGGVNLFRASGAVARLFVEVGHSRSGRTCLGDADAVAEYVVLNGSGEVTTCRSLAADEYEAWVDWVEPITGSRMGKPRLAGAVRQGSPRFAQMGINVTPQLSLAAEESPEVSVALDRAQQAALTEIRRWFAQRAVTRIGAKGAQAIVPVEQLQVVGIAHRVTRAGRPYRHLHMQFGTRVWAEGGWRALSTGGLFAQQAEIRRIGSAMIANDRELAEALARHGVMVPDASPGKALGRASVLPAC